MGLFSLVTGMKGPSGFGSASTAEEVTQGINARNLTAIVTGGASGIGEETVRVLALRGAHVIIAARNMEAAQRTKDSIIASNPSARIDTMKVDLSSITSVRAFSENFNSAGLPLNILINNAGIMFCPFKLSEDGIEMQFATNHVGHFLLTELLTEKMKKTAKETGIEGRIVNLSSVMHRFPYMGGIRFDKINDKSRYIDKLAYGQSKLANVLHANELSLRLKAEGANISQFYSSRYHHDKAHEIFLVFDEISSCRQLSNLEEWDAWWGADTFACDTPRAGEIQCSRGGVVTMNYGPPRIFGKNVPQGAATTCYVALHPKVKGITGEYFCDCNITKASKLARKENLAKALWDFTGKLVKNA